MNAYFYTLKFSKPQPYFDPNPQPNPSPKPNPEPERSCTYSIGPIL